MDYQEETLVGSKGSDLPHMYMAGLASNNLCTELVAMVSQRRNHWKMHDGALVIEKHHMRYAFCGSSRSWRTDACAQIRIRIRLGPWRNCVNARAILIISSFI